jgi:hypothetical protein
MGGKDLTMAKRMTVDTTRYCTTYGHHPKNWYGHWAFALDLAPDVPTPEHPLIIVAHYTEALKQAKAQTQHPSRCCHDGYNPSLSSGHRPNRHRTQRGPRVSGPKS